MSMSLIVLCGIGGILPGQRSSETVRVDEGLLDVGVGLGVGRAIGHEGGEGLGDAVGRDADEAEIRYPRCARRCAFPLGVVTGSRCPTFTWRITPRWGNRTMIDFRSSGSFLNVSDPSSPVFPCISSPSTSQSSGSIS